MSLPDPRLTLARAGLAADWCEGVIAADRYVRPKAMTCRSAWAPLRRAPDDEAEQWDQLLLGEGFAVLDEAGGWALGQAGRDGYVGYAPLASLVSEAGQPSHWVSVRAALAFAEPDIKSKPRGPYAMNSLVSADVREGRFVHAAGCGWFVERQLSSIGEGFDDPAGVALQFLGAPYLWGGRGPWGIDCSGLVQQALFACARACPRDADQQMTLGHEADPAGLKRGDLVFWPGHVAMMVDRTRLVHATVHHMATTVEPLATAVDRIRAESGEEPTAFRRPAA